MRKIIIKVVFLITVPQYVFANDFYIGGGIGVSDFADRQLITAPTDPSAAPTTHDYSGLGFLSSIIAGYRFDLYKRFNLGLEAFFTGSNNQIGVDDISINPANEGQLDTTMRVSQRYAYGLRLLPGYEVMPHLVGHAIIGISRGTFRLIDNGAYALADSNFSVYGPQFGLGTSIELLKNVDLRLDAIYTKYPNHHDSASGPLPKGGNFGYYYDSLSTFDTVLSLTYRFNFL